MTRTPRHPGISPECPPGHGPQGLERALLHQLCRRRRPIGIGLSLIASRLPEGAEIIPVIIHFGLLGLSPPFFGCPDFFRACLLDVPPGIIPRLRALGILSLVLVPAALSLRPALALGPLLLLPLRRGRPNMRRNRVALGWCRGSSRDGHLLPHEARRRHHRGRRSGRPP